LSAIHLIHLAATVNGTSEPTRTGLAVYRDWRRRPGEAVARGWRRESDTGLSSRRGVLAASGQRSCLNIINPIATTIVTAAALQSHTDRRDAIAPGPRRLELTARCMPVPGSAIGAHFIFAMGRESPPNVPLQMALTNRRCNHQSSRPSGGIARRLRCASSALWCLRMSSNGTDVF
jgi:hypothetical protein